MKYMGGKARLAKSLIEIMFSEPTGIEYYIEPFCGGCNVIDKVPSTVKKIANDGNRFVVEMFRSLMAGWQPPDHISREYYGFARDHKHLIPMDMLGWVGVNCSYSGKWFGGYAGITETKQGVRNYQAEAIRNVQKQIKNLTDITFLSVDYRELEIPENSIVYCDPPYAGTTGYKDGFDNEAFWTWCRKLPTSCQVYISEYEAPDDFECVYEQPVRSSLSANGRYGKSKQSIEKLFKRMI